MEVMRRVTATRGLMTLYVQVNFDDGERRLIDEYGFLDFRIKTEDGAFVGRNSLSRNTKSAYRTHIGKVKNRWSPGVVRTSGFAAIDLIWTLLSFIKRMARGAARLFIGRRRTLRSAIKGITVRSSRIERIKEAEFFIFVSLAAIARALDYAAQFGEEKRYQGFEFAAEVEGLDFAGAGSEIEDELEPVTAAMEQWSKLHN